MAGLTRLSLAASLAVGLGTLAATPSASAEPEKRRGRFRDQSDPESGYVDPYRRKPPRTHRFRLGIEVWYVRLTAAIDSSGFSQRFHLAPIGVDVAYQAQFLKWFMVRPAFAVAVNAANTNTSMPVLVHPKLHFGYQGSILGVAFGYGYFTPVVFAANVSDPIRGGLGQPIMLHNHHLDLELSITTRIDRGALSFIARGGINNGKVWHYDIRHQRSWRPMLTFNVGWYFGDGKRARERRRQRQERGY